MVENLALKIGKVHHIAINDPNSADAGSGQVIGHRASQASSTHNKHFRLRQFLLALAADFRQEYMAAITGNLIVSETHVSITFRRTVRFLHGISGGRGWGRSPGNYMN